MKKLLALFFVTAVAVLASVPSFPEQLKLNSGAILRQTKFVRWGADSVTVRHAGGVDPVKLSLLDPADKALVIAYKAACDAPHTVQGTVFITTLGNGAYKFTNTMVYVYPEEALAGATYKPGAMARWKPLATATTNADGHFTIKIPRSDPAFLYCVAYRLVRSAYVYDWWAVPIKGDEIDLTNENRSPF